MSSWTEGMASVVAACGPRQGPPSGLPYHRRLEKVKFGVSLDQVCKRDIPGPLLVMLLKLNKEGPFKKDVFRAPGHQGNMKKLIHFLQQGRLVNIHSFSVNTIASVLKKFLRKLPGGIFGPENEADLFRVIKSDSEEEKLATVRRIFMSLPVYSQHLLVLLFGTFRVIHSNSERAKTGMTAEALGVSVAPSFFHTCVSEGKIARPEEVNKFKLATKITTFFIEHFGMGDLLGRENYEYYARLTGRILKVEDEWIFFTYPPVIFGGAGGVEEVTDGTGAGSPSGGGGSVGSGGGGGKSRPRSQKRRQRRDSDPSCLSGSGADGSGGAEGVGGGGGSGGGAPDGGGGDMVPIEKTTTGSLEIIPESCPLDPNGRLSISLDDRNVSSPSGGSCESHHHHRAHVHDFRTQTGAGVEDEVIPGAASDLAVASRGDEMVQDIAGQEYCLPQWNYSRRHSSAAACTAYSTSAIWESCPTAVGGAAAGGGGPCQCFYCCHQTAAASPARGVVVKTEGQGRTNAGGNFAMLQLPEKPPPEIKHVWKIGKSSAATAMPLSTSADAEAAATPKTPETNVVHERQTERMRHRSEWFLSDPTGLVTVKCRPAQVDRPSSLGAGGQQQQQQQQLLMLPPLPNPLLSSPTHHAAVFKMDSSTSTPVNSSSSPFAGAGATTSPLPPKSPNFPLFQSPVSTSGSWMAGASGSHHHLQRVSPVPPALASGSGAGSPFYLPSPSFSSSVTRGSGGHSPFHHAAAAAGGDAGARNAALVASSPRLFSPFTSYQPPSGGGDGGGGVSRNIAASSSSADCDMPSSPPPLPPTTTQAAPHAAVGATTHQMSSSSIPASHNVHLSGLVQMPQGAASAGVPPVAPPSGANQGSNSSSGSSNNVRLRRRLSDKDKERRLVRRSSSKRKDKENGGGGGKISTSSSSLDKASHSIGGSTGAIGPPAAAAAAASTSSQAAAAADGGSPSAMEITSTTSGPSSLDTTPYPTSSSSKPRSAQLKRAGSADAGGGSASTVLPAAALTAVAATTSPSPTAFRSGGGGGGGVDHPALCRTGSHDHPPHVELPAVLNRGGAGVSSAGGGSSPLTRSLPRI